MLILDSNVWVYLATAKEYPESIYSEKYQTTIDFFGAFVTGDRITAVSEYMVDEIAEGIERSERVSGENQDIVLTKFYKLLRTCGSIEDGYEPLDLSDYTLYEARQLPEYQMLGSALNIQAKDAPILAVAFDHYFQEPHILTDDGGFGELDPAEYGMPKISIETLDLDWE